MHCCLCLAVAFLLLMEFFTTKKKKKKCIMVGLDKVLDGTMKIIFLKKITLLNPIYIVHEGLNLNPVSLEVIN